MVSALRYCYSEDVGTEELLSFTLLTLEQNGLNFMIRDVISVHSTPTSQICSSGVVPFLGTVQYCCDMLMLDTLDQFPLPAPNFAFGIATSNSVHLLNFNGGNFPQYAVDQYIRSIGTLGSLTVGSTITVNSQNTQLRFARTLRLFQFVISKLYLQ